MRNEPNAVGRPLSESPLGPLAGSSLASSHWAGSRRSAGKFCLPSLTTIQSSCPNQARYVAQLAVPDETKTGRERQQPGPCLSFQPQNRQRCNFERIISVTSFGDKVNAWPRSDPSQFTTSFNESATRHLPNGTPQPNDTPLPELLVSLGSNKPAAGVTASTGPPSARRLVIPNIYRNHNVTYSDGKEFAFQLGDDRSARPGVDLAEQQPPRSKQQRQAPNSTTSPSSDSPIESRRSKTTAPCKNHNRRASKRSSSQPRCRIPATTKISEATWQPSPLEKAFLGLADAPTSPCEAAELGTGVTSSTETKSGGSSSMGTSRFAYSSSMYFPTHCARKPAAQTWGYPNSPLAPLREPAKSGGIFESRSFFQENKDASTRRGSSAWPFKDTSGQRSTSNRPPTQPALDQREPKLRSDRKCRPQRHVPVLGLDCTDGSERARDGFSCFKTTTITDKRFCSPPVATLSGRPVSSHPCVRGAPRLNNCAIGTPFRLSTANPRMPTRGSTLRLSADFGHHRGSIHCYHLPSEYPQERPTTLPRLSVPAQPPHEASRADESGHHHHFTTRPLGDSAAAEQWISEAATLAKWNRTKAAPLEAASALPSSRSNISLVADSIVSPSPSMRITRRRNTTHPVFLRIYDVTAGKATKYSKFLLGKKLTGIWHTSVLVYGFEYFYGREILRLRPSEVRLWYGATPDEEIFLGESSMPRHAFERYLTSIADVFAPDMYHIERWNCNHFSNACLWKLLDMNVPRHILEQSRAIGETAWGRVALILARLMSYDSSRGKDTLETWANSAHKLRRSEDRSTGKVTDSLPTLP